MNPANSVEEIAREIQNKIRNRPMGTNVGKLSLDLIADALRAERDKAPVAGICTVHGYHEICPECVQDYRRRETESNAVFEELHETLVRYDSFFDKAIEFRAEKERLGQEIAALQTRECKTVEEFWNQEIVVICSECEGTVMYKREGNRVKLIHSCTPKRIRESYSKLQGELITERERIDAMNVSRLTNKEFDPLDDTDMPWRIR